MTVPEVGQVWRDRRDPLLTVRVVSVDERVDYEILTNDGGEPHWFGGERAVASIGLEPRWVADDIRLDGFDEIFELVNKEGL